MSSGVQPTGRWLSARGPAYAIGLFHNVFHFPIEIVVRRQVGSAATQTNWLPAVPTRSRSYAKLTDMLTTTSVVTLEAVTQQIVALVGKDAGDFDLAADSSLQSQGLDSLKIISLVFKIEEQFDIVLDEEDADDLRTFGDLAVLVFRHIEQQS